MVEQLGGFLGLVFGNQGFGFAFERWNLVEGLLLEAVGGAEKRLLGAAPLHSGQFVGLAVMPNPSFLAVAQLTAFVEAIGSVLWQIVSVAKVNPVRALKKE